MPRLNFGSFASGIAGGLSLAQDMDIKSKREVREQKQSDQIGRIRDLGIQKAEKEAPLVDKEVALKGAQLDFDNSEVQFKTDMQGFEQNTRRLLSQNAQTAAANAGTQGQIDASALGAQLQNQPDELKVAREELSNKVSNAVRRQTANIWSVAKSGNTDAALDMYNRSMLVTPGEKAKAFRLEDMDTQGADGKPTKAKVLVIDPDGDGKPRRIPVSTLDQLEQQFGATYHKFGNSLVRQNRDGSVTPLYEGDNYAANPESGGVFNKRTGLPPPAAAGGVNGPAPGIGRKAEAHVDDRVKMAIDKVILPKYGGKFEGGMFFPDEANKDVALRATALAGEMVRRGVDPEQAGAQAIAQAEREKTLKAVGGGANSTPGGAATGYSGPTPWKR